MKIFHFAGFLLLSLLVFDHAQSEVYEYRNANGRLVRSTSPPAGSHSSRATVDREEIDIGHHCRDEWGKDFRMREYCLKRQIEARRKIQEYSMDIVEYCRNEWPNDYTMIEHCAKNQTQAKRRLGE